MDHQKVEQTLKKIFDRYGRDIVKDHSRFRSAVMDLLDPVNCKDERIVLKHAMDCDIFWALLETVPLTENVAEKMVQQMQSDAHMTQEDSQFVVRCIMALRDGDEEIRQDTCEDTLEWPCKVLGKRTVGYKKYSPAKLSLQSDRLVISMGEGKQAKLLIQDIKKVGVNKEKSLFWFFCSILICNSVLSQMVPIFDSQYNPLYYSSGDEIVFRFLMGIILNTLLSVCFFKMYFSLAEILKKFCCYMMVEFSGIIFAAVKGFKKWRFFRWETFCFFVVLSTLLFIRYCFYIYCSVQQTMFLEICSNTPDENREKIRIRFPSLWEKMQAAIMIQNRMNKKV